MKTGKADSIVASMCGSAQIGLGADASPADHRRSKCLQPTESRIMVRGKFSKKRQDHRTMTRGHFAQCLLLPEPATAISFGKRAGLAGTSVSVTTRLRNVVRSRSGPVKSMLRNRSRDHSISLQPGFIHCDSCTDEPGLDFIKARLVSQEGQLKKSRAFARP